MEISGRAFRFFALACLMTETLVWAGNQPSGDVTLVEGTRISIQLNDYLSTKSNNEGDVFTATVTAPVYQGDRLVIPKGSIVTGSISRIIRPGRFRGKAVMNIIFHSIRIPGHGQVPIMASLARVDADGNERIRTEGTIEGEGSAGSDAARILTPGLTGAGIGGLAGGGKGAAVGAGVGAAIGLATVFATRGKDLEMHKGAAMDIALERPLLIAQENEVQGARNR